MQLSIAMTSLYAKRNRFFQDSLKTKQGNTIEPVAHKQGKPIDTKSFDTQNLKVIPIGLAAQLVSRLTCLTLQYVQRLLLDYKYYIKRVARPLRL